MFYIKVHVYQTTICLKEQCISKNKDNMIYMRISHSFHFDRILLCLRCGNGSIGLVDLGLWFQRNIQSHKELLCKTI